MFTGIIETLGTIETRTARGTGQSFWISSPFTSELNPDQSVSHNGVCMTIEEISGPRFRVTAIQETLLKTNISDWKTGDSVNLERCLVMNGRLDGHIVQGHVDGTGKCVSIQPLNGSWEYRFEFAGEFAPFIIEKGSICVNGISLTAYNVGKTEFAVGIIPYTYEHTNIGKLKTSERVNLEFDVVGKYIQRLVSLK